MDNIPTTIYIAFGTVIAAIITAVITILSSVITKESKVSELRQCWIDELRKELSQLISIVNTLNITWFLKDEKSEKTRRIWMKEHINEVRDIDELTHRLRMRLNPEEDGELIRLVLCLEGFASSAEKLENDTALKLAYELYTKESQRVLKREWTKVKNGEDSYRTIILYSKRVVSTSFILLAILFVIA